MKIQKSEVRSQKSGARKFAPGLSPICYLPSPARRERGIALVITLIMLSVTLIMAVAFLALSRRERSAVATTTDTAAARLAADSALAAAQAQIAANVFATTNAGAYDYHLLVSTNYINPVGYVPAIPTNPTNVNYDYRFGGGALNSDDLIQNVANLYYLPRVPVYVNTNAGSPLDFRFYLDLNRNGQFETNGWGAEIDGTGATIGSAFHVGDPEWIGVLERPDQPHGPNNHFVARYAFLAQPIGNGLDLNYVHNAARLSSQTFFSPLGRDFSRNQGVGSWEINLGAFLTDLNTNIYAWDASSYTYDPANGFIAGGNGFADAAAIYSYRLNGSASINAYNTTVLNSVNNLFGTAGVNAFSFDLIDGYSDGPIQTTTALPSDNDSLDTGNPWPGANNYNRFFSLPSDLFDTNKVGISFTNRLLITGNSTDTYDRYTLYRLLDQLGTDSTADDGRMNLNYDNLDPYIHTVAGVTYTNAPSETNFMAWTPLEFFTNAANRLLTNSTTAWLAASGRDYAATFNVTNAFGVTGIPVLVSNQFVYSPAVNRLLQLAANVYDASTTNFYPSVFRPQFTVVPNGAYKDVFITGYTYVSTVAGSGDLNYFSTPFDATTIAATNASSVPANVNVYGVPWIIGAKKGLPNFNQFYMFNAMTVTRKLQVSRPSLNSLPTQTNQMYIFSISNSLGCQLWNSYTNSYVGNLTVVTRDVFSAVLTNDAPGFVRPQILNYLYAPPPLTTNNWNWPGTAWSMSPPETTLDADYPTPFIIPLNTNAVLLADSIYRYGTSPYFEPLTNSGSWQTNVYTPPLPRFGLLMTNRLQVFILDGNHVIDYVHFAGPETNLDLTAKGGLTDPDSSGDPAYLWSTNSYKGGATPYGVMSQIAVSKGDANPAPNIVNFWKAPPNMPSVGSLSPDQIPQAEQAFFGSLINGKTNFSFNNKTYPNFELAVQAPYTPTRLVYNLTTWQANDPLVHYLASDLNYSDPGTTGFQLSDSSPPVVNLPKLDAVTTRYSPWGLLATNSKPNSVDANPYNLQYKDPLMWRSDNWDFSTNKFPTPGWLGRVHRGTPWQTVYLKASDVLTNVTSFGGAPVYVGTNTWAQWTGDQNFFDAVNSAPLSDRNLFDLFTTRFNDNAAHGTLSVNQDNFAAWSAVFGGMVALENVTLSPSPDAAPVVTNLVIASGGANGTNSALGRIYNGILATRANTNLFPAGVFTHVGDVLRAPQLTEQSPFLNFADAQNQNDRLHDDISDELYEWLPQQALGLLRVSTTPRYVVYCYGQALRPAANSIVTSGGQYFGLCTNYQIMAESAARAVIRMDRNVFTNAAGDLGTNYGSTVESFNVLPPN